MRVDCGVCFQEEAYTRGLRKPDAVEKARLEDQVERHQDEIVQLKEEIAIHMSRKQPTNFTTPCGNRNPSCGY